VGGSRVSQGGQIKRMELAELCIWNKALYDAETSDISKSRSEIPGKF